MRRLRAAGAIIVGKTHAPEVGQWHFTESPAFGATRNPWHLDHTPGGSSGGAAAAVAAGLVAGAIGSDGAGSVRIPAAWCGLVGLKPQRGRISTWPDARPSTASPASARWRGASPTRRFCSTRSRGNVPADLHQPPRPAGLLTPRPPPSAGAAADRGQPSRPLRHPRPPLRRASHRHRASSPDGSKRSATRSIAVDPDYGLVAPALVPRGMAGVRDWIRDHEIDDRARSSPAPASTPGSAAPSPAPAARRPRRRAATAPAPRPHLRRPRRGPHPDHGQATAADRRPRPPRLLGDRLRRQRDLPLRLPLERHRLARHQRPRRPHRRGPADRRPAARPRKRRGPLLVLGAELETAAGGEWTERRPSSA